MREVGEGVAGAIVKRTATAACTLDVDATVIEGEKEGAKWTYKEVAGYQPISGFLAETGICLTHYPGLGRLDFSTSPG